MSGISGWVGETTDRLLWTRKHDGSKALWDEEEITLAIKMGREVREEGWTTASQCSCHCEGLGLCGLNWVGVVCQAVGFYSVYSNRLTLGCFTQVKTFQAFFDPVWVTLAVWGLAVIAPSPCLSCAEHDFIGAVRQTAPLSVLQLLKAEIMRGRKERKNRKWSWMYFYNAAHSFSSGKLVISAVWEQC